jgi:hypothetical protein
MRKFLLKNRLKFADYPQEFRSRKTYLVVKTQAGKEI